MPQRKATYLKKVLAVQADFNSRWDYGMFTKRKIWQLYIYPKYYISERTMYAYFDINAKKQLRELGLLNECKHDYLSTEFGIKCSKCGDFQPFNK